MTEARGPVRDSRRAACCGLVKVLLAPTHLQAVAGLLQGKLGGAAPRLHVQEDTDFTVQHLHPGRPHSTPGLGFGTLAPLHPGK